MKKALSAFFVALCCICSHADTNTVDLTEIETTLESMLTLLQSVEEEISNKVQYTLKWEVHNIAEQVLQAQNVLSSFKTQQNSNITTLRNVVAAQFNILNGVVREVNTNLVSSLDYLLNISQNSDTTSQDLYACRVRLEDIYNTLYSCNNWLYSIAQNTESLPRIEAYQSVLSVIVSNINEHILSGINVTIPNTINVNVQNPLNFNPEWDFLSRTFQWSGWNFDNTWQQFITPDSQDNTLQGAAPMSIPATTTLAEYLERLYVGINNSSRILNDSIIHACYLLEGSNTVSQAEQEEASESVDSSVSSAPTKIEEVSSSIPTPSFGVDTSYIRRGLGFWDHVYNIQKPTSIILRTSPSDGDLISVPEIYIEIKLSDYPALDKLLEFCRAVFTWLWWVLSVFFLIWLFKRGFALYTMVMGMLGPKPVQASADDVI